MPEQFAGRELRQVRQQLTELKDLNRATQAAVQQIGRAVGIEI
ncbi:MAG TPA: hypothetical protein VMG11_04920 [Steroidobacteraceae bacterium]|nr:hypothetical protein [Steroidobacteraceae bacterium]